MPFCLLITHAIHVSFFSYYSFLYFYQAVNGATCVNIDMIKSKKDGSRMLLIEGTQLYMSRDFIFFNQVIVFHMFLTLYIP